MSTSLYIGELHPTAVEKDLVEVFSQPFEAGCENGMTAKINRDVYSGASRCSGFLNFLTAEVAERTLRERQHAIVHGKPVVLRAYIPRPQKVHTPGLEEEQDLSGAAVLSPLESIIPECNTFVTSVVLDQMTEEDLQKLFLARFDEEVVSCHIPPGKKHGYVMFKSQESADAAIKTGSISFSRDGDEVPEGEGEAASVAPTNHTITICRYKSYQDRARIAAEKKFPMVPIVSKLNCVTIRGAPSTWSVDNVKEAAEMYGTITSVRFVPGFRSSEAHILVEFSHPSMVQKCIDGLNRRWFSHIDNFSLLDAPDSERYSLIVERHPDEHETPPHRLFVAAFKADSSPFQKSKAKNQKSNNSKVKTPKKSPRKQVQEQVQDSPNMPLEPPIVAETVESH
eukprot:GHVH01008327.1.p1 GENE.GHVH01008327.1~~GHVH01008327.1.p1  ORF type:complete len:396 (+),score=59.29 GHVH01008327.1:35-1222(+)